MSDERILGRLDTLTNVLEKIVSDHEKRLRVLERVLSYGLGAACAAKLLFDLLK